MIALDAMGGDIGLHQSVPAVAQALLVYPAQKFMIVGDDRLLAPVLDAYGLRDHPNICCLHTASVIGHDDHVKDILRAKQYQHSSMWLALEQVAQGRARACVSAGNTGALVALSKLSLGLIPGISRSALMAEIPNQSQKSTVMLDLGANLECSERLLYQFSWMGHVYAKEVLRIGRPKVALLNVGEESHKGSQTIKNAARLLEKSGLNYQGFIEGDKIFSGFVDVIVCNGFVGNVAIKTAQSVARLFMHSMQRKAVWRLIGKWILKNKLSHWSPDRYNGASLLGLRGVIIKSHGGASSDGFYQAITRAVESVRHDLCNQMAQQLRPVTD